MYNFKAMEIELPKTGNSTVKEAGSYICALVKEAVKLLTDREDNGNNPNLKERGDEFTPPWADETPQLFMQFKTIADSKSISDRFQLLGYEHFDPQNPPTAEQKAKWAKEFEEMDIIISKKAGKPVFSKAEYRGTVYVCGVATDGKQYRVINDENTMKSRRRLSSALAQLGIKLSTSVASWEAEIQACEDVKNIVVNLEDKAFDGDRRSTTKLFKISYGERKEKVALKEVISQEL